ncbi:TolC family protein [Gramella jeungdoensis]|uniref:TolC family protein n=1 Tax=Gramella jeungdoensis TaxID=708091 RepID=A0ABT0Z477_9FLAO|nr:TolC family protein [Gramella jeungdoensis]MCM8570030.1 TolC family protein [Gramella jeungdoensis]
MKKIRLFLILFLFVAGLKISAQQVHPISKDSVLERVMENNRTLKISEQEFLQARADYRQTNAVFLPNISVSHTGMTTNNPLMAFGSKLNQERITQSDFDPALLNDPDRINNFATKIEVEQPLVNIDGIYHRKAAKSKMKATRLKSERTGDYMTLEVEKAYMELQLAYKAVNVLEKALEAAISNQKMASDRYKQGYLQKADILSVEVRVSEINNRLHYAKSNLENSSDYLEFLMGKSQEGILKPTDSLQINSLIDPENTGISEERSDIKAMELATEARQEMYTADKMNFLPRLNAFGSYELYDEDIFQGDASGYIAGISLSWDVFQGSKRIGKMQKSKAEYEQAKLEYEEYFSKSTMELNRARRALKDAENKLNLNKLAMEQSEESLRIRTNRFEEGLEITSDLLSAEAKYLEKELEYYQTIYEYNYAKAYLEFLTKK